MKLVKYSVALLILGLGLTGCAAKSPIVSEWYNPAYSAASFKRIMVAGLGTDTSVRRSFEDEFVFQLRAAGIDALPSYRFIGEDEKLDEARLKEISQKANADATLFARSIKVVIAPSPAGSLSRAT